MKKQPKSQASGSSQDQTESKMLGEFIQAVKETKYGNQQVDINQNELYVIPGDVLVQAYNYLQYQRRSALIWLNRIPPDRLDDVEQYLDIYRTLSIILMNITNAVPLMKMMPTDGPVKPGKRSKAKSPKPNEGELTDLLKRFKIDPDAKMDESNRPPPPPEDEQDNLE
jgi:hypothetical protein